MKRKKMIVSILLIFTVAFAVWLIWSNVSVQTSRVSVSSADLPDSFIGFRIAHVSDLHNAEFGENNERLLKKLKNANPDIIAITGDSIDSRHTDMDVTLKFIEQAMEIAQCYFVVGNHEARLSKSEYQHFESRLTELGVIVLHNESAIIERNGEKITVFGVDDLNFDGDFYENLKRGAGTGGFTLLLSHRPEYFELYAEKGYDLVLSGHAHGGQFRLPLVGGLYAPMQGVFPKYDAGAYTQNDTTMVVSRGLGNSSFPIRFNNRPELVIIELNKGEEKMSKNVYKNPVNDGADPFVLLHEGTYYLYSTNSSDGFRVYSSEDMSTWIDRGYCLRAQDVMGDKGFWAPEVMFRNGKFYMVYVANEHLGIAVSESPLGPFVQEEKRWLNELNEIDGHFFVDDDGTVYLYFVRFDDGNVIWCAKMNDDMLSYDKSTAKFLFRAEDEWELRDCSVVEGPFVLKHNGKYYLTYSANHTRSEDYAVGYAVADNPMGPFVKADCNPILKKNEYFNGTGHHSFTTSKDGGELICVYHARPCRDTSSPRRTCIDRAAFVPNPNGGDDILVIYGPTWDKQKAFE